MALFDKLASAALITVAAAVAVAASDDKDEDGSLSYRLTGNDAAYMPAILRDFPDFQLEPAKAAVTDYGATKLEEEHKGEKIKRFVSHGTVVLGYQRRQAGASILFQTMLVMEVENGNEVEKHEALFETEYGCGFDLGNASRCGFCGAPIRNMGVRRCEYCGSGWAPEWKVVRIHNMSFQ